MKSCTVGNIGNFGIFKYLKVQVLQLRHLMKRVQGYVTQVVVAEVKGDHGAETLKGHVGQPGEIQGVGHFQVAQSRKISNNAWVVDTTIC